MTGETGHSAGGTDRSEHPLVIEESLGWTRDGGSCSRCGADYRGRPYDSGRGRRVLARTEPGVVEPINLCQSCAEEVHDDR
jgi:hypothetical protein